MRIAYIIPALIQTGPVILLQNLLKGLLKYPVDIDIYYFKPSLDLQLTCNSYKIKYNSPIEFDKYDIIHSHCFLADRYVNKWRKHIKVAKTVTTIHQDTLASFKFDFPNLLAKLFTLCWYKIQSRFDAICCISKQTYQVAEQIKKNKYVIYNGVNIDDNAQIQNRLKEKILSFKGEKHLICTYANIVPRKNIEQVIRILSKCKEYKFLIIGNGPHKNNLIDLTHKLGVEKQVLFIPAIEHPYTALDYADIYVMPSISEGFGLSMVEAALKQKAIVCSNISSFHELFNDSEVEFFDLKNDSTLIAAINKAYNNRLLLGRRAQDKALSLYTYITMADNYYSLYQKLIKTR